ncbi:restriction endonuclease [Candidatus Woesearchaeota archaeon]|nr:restriction endonuclease [Candidatus Woesearchaeota archaeon]
MEDKPLMLDGLDGYQFEELIAKIMKKKGYQNIRVTQKSHDVGKDIIMEGNNNDIFLVECKHQHFVGRPIIQKLQGAMNHEEMKHPDKEIKGIVVTSGSFSQEAIAYNKQIGQEIELIDGKKLKNLCNELKIVILNGKIQIITNNSFENINEKQPKELALKGYSKIYGNQEHKAKVKSELVYNPACYIRYNVSFDTYTSVGLIDSYNHSGQIIIDGVTGKELDEHIQGFYFTSRFDTDEIQENSTHKTIPYEFTENDIEEHAVNKITEQHTHEVSYTGNNNVSYSKNCTPKRRDIDIKEFIPIYLPLWTNEIAILKMNYKQQFYVKGEHNRLFLIDELKKCKICERQEMEYEKMSICPECGRIICKNHVKIDYLDKKTPICSIHAKSVKIFLQNKYFATKENSKKYQEWLESRNFFQKLYEDKVAFSLSILGVFGLIWLIISWIK